MNRSTASHRRLPPAAFTLVELLVVISIMGILAALIVWGAAHVNDVNKRKRVHAELKHLEAAIDHYKHTLGYYPPDNPIDPTTPPLFYELGGCLYNKANDTYTNLLNYSAIKKTPDVNNNFGRKGFSNANADPTEVRGFFHGGLKANKYADIGGGVLVLVVPVEGPAYTNPVTKAVVPNVNTWHYNSSHPAHQSDYDLWAEITIRGNTVKIGNWKK